MIRRLLIANRGEIAVRIAATAAEMGIAAIAVHPEDDAGSLHVTASTEARLVAGAGPSAYLSIPALIAAAREAECDAIHPGYGFLSENAAFARACADAAIIFIGPSPETLDLFGDKARARDHAAFCDVPVLEGTSRPTSLDEARDFQQRLGSGETIMVKAIAGGGGRGMRPVSPSDDLAAAFARCAAEAEAAFGDGTLYVERFLPRARHIEVQLIGDGSAVSHVWDRECSLQRGRQKLVEWAPAERLPEILREQLREGALAMGRAAGLRSLCTVEFLVGDDGRFAFIEANARLQVEHTVTEEITGLDLVRAQIEIAGGATLSALRLDQPRIPAPRGTALQARINLETMTAAGEARPTTGTITTYAPPAGRGVRVDGAGYAGWQAGVRYDALLAKLIVAVAAGGVAAAAAKAGRALAEFTIEGQETNISFLRALLGAPDVRVGVAWVTLIEERIAALLMAQSALVLPNKGPAAHTHGSERVRPVTPDGAIALESPMVGMLVGLGASDGAEVRAGQEIAVVEAMKMQHGLVAPQAGTVVAVAAAVGDTLSAGDPILFIRPSHVATDAPPVIDQIIDLDAPRAALSEVLDRQRGTLDAARPAAVARRRKTGQRTARENIADLLDPGSFVEYGGLTIAGRSRRASTEALIEQSPADGLVMGLGTVGAEVFGEGPARVAAMSYDYTVFAGTQGARNHVKTDRIVELADRWRIPLVLFAEGGGGRPGDTDGGGFIRAFETFPKLSGKVPIIGIVSGRCFAGNAALLGCCDVIIATQNATIGMGGPAMIEGGGLGVFTPEEVGPAGVHVANGVIDVLVDDEAAAVALAKRYLGYFQGTLPQWSCADQRLLRHAIPADRLRVYDVRALIDTLVDSGSLLELRRGFGLAMVTALARIEGRPIAIIANDPTHIGGAIDSDAADKAARFMQLCEAHRIPLVSLSDTPGIMVGPEAEKTGLIRHAARLFLAGANLTVPLLSVVLRKSYGLGAIAMTGGSYQASLFAVSWPSGEFGGMGLEGAVKLGYRKELEALTDPAERQAKFDTMVAELYQRGKALTTAGYFGIDDVIDPADTRRWIVAALATAHNPKEPDEGLRSRWIDSW